VTAQDAYPLSGYDVMTSTAQISIYDPADSSVLLEVVPMEGYVVIFRSDPYVPAGTAAKIIDTRVDTLFLAGYSVTQADSVFATLDRDGLPSTGRITQITAHTDFPAVSFFDVYYKLTFGSAPSPPGPGGKPKDATFHGRLNYDAETESAVLSTGATASFSTEFESGRSSSPDKAARELCIECSPTWTTEGEACDGDNNGGCNSAPPVFEDINCGDTICGTAWADNGVRDTDWYQFRLASQMTIKVTGAADFPFMLGFVDTADCALTAAVDPVATGPECEVISASRVAGPGTYWVFAAPNTGYRVFCGQNSQYWFTLECTTTEYKPGEPPHMVDTIWQIPPRGRVFVDLQKRPVVDPASGDTLGWVRHRYNADPPPQGEDTLPTVAFLQVWFGPDQPDPTQPPDEVDRFDGQTVIMRGDPYDPGDGHLEVQTEILSMDLTGNSNMFGSGLLSLPGPAPGLVKSILPQPDFFPAESFFDVFYAVEFAAAGVVLQPFDPPRLHATIEAIPPLDNEFMPVGDLHPVFEVSDPDVVYAWVRPSSLVNPILDTCSEQRPGDFNNDGSITAEDLANLTNYVHCVGPAPVTLANGDVNGDCVINQADVVDLQTFLSTGGPPPVECTCVNPQTPPCCCIGLTRGDVNYDGAEPDDISDLVYLIDYMFRSGAPPLCWSETNTDCSDNSPTGDGREDIDISDLLRLIDYMFTQGPLPCRCDCSDCQGK